MRTQICLKCPKLVKRRGFLSCVNFADLNTAIIDPESKCARWKDVPVKAENIFFNKDNQPLHLENMFKNQAVFFVSNGPSRNELDLDLMHQPGIMTMTINNGGHDFRSNFWISEDTTTKFMQSIWEDPTIMKFRPIKSKNSGYYDFKTKKLSTNIIRDCPNMVYHTRNSDEVKEDWFTKDSISWSTPTEMGRGRSTMIAGLHVLTKLGFKYIYLVGVDFGGGKYCFNQNIAKSKSTHHDNLFKKMNKYFDYMQPIFLENDLHILNCNLNSGLKSFPFINYEEAINRHTISLTDSTEGMYDGANIRGILH